MNYQSVYTVTSAGAAGSTWTLDGQLIPHPLTFGAANYTDTAGTHQIEFLNTQVAGATSGARVKNWSENFKRWRLAYAGVTIYQDGPDLANQGTVVVCQKPVEPMVHSIVPTGDLYVDGGLGFCRCTSINADDLPAFASSQAMPNAYFGRSKEGVYIPLKLTNTIQKWHSISDFMLTCESGTVTDLSDAGIGGRMTLATTLAVPSGPYYPFFSNNDCHVYNDGAGVFSLKGQAIPDYCNSNWADFSFKNLAVTTSLSFFYRFGFEVQVLPTSQMSPHLKLSPKHDPAALNAYFAISRELKDAYPADFNDLGMIWDIISSAAKAVAPALGAIPVAGPVLQYGLPALAGLGDAIKDAIKRSAQPTIGSTASMADKEKARDASNNITAMVLGNKPKKKIEVVYLNKKMIPQAPPFPPRKK
jgi:hypothetical protein